MSLHWFEVVALAQTLCQAIVDQSGSGNLDLAKAFLTEEGTVDLAKPPDPGKAFPHIRKLVNDMVPPYEFAVAKVLPDSSIGDFLNALAYYERPNRDEIVKSIYTRFRSQVVANTLVLPTRPIEQPPPEAPTAEEVKELAARRSRLLQMIAVVAFLACIAVAGVWVLNNPAVQSRFNAYAATLTSLAVGGTVPGYGNSEPAPASPAPEAEHNDPPPTTRARAAKPAGAPAARPVPRSESRSAAAPATLPAPSESLTSEPPATSPSSATPPPIATGPQRAPVFAPPQPPAPQVAASTAPAVAVVDPLEDAPVFDASQRDVTPPQFVSPGGPPSVPEGLDPKTAPALEVLVNERGIVDGAKTCSPPHSLAESMEMMSEISAAKMWRFRPAMRDGRPVKYRLIVKLGPR